MKSRSDPVDPRLVFSVRLLCVIASDSRLTSALDSGRGRPLDASVLSPAVVSRTRVPGGSGGVQPSVVTTGGRDGGREPEGSRGSQEGCADVGVGGDSVSLERKGRGTVWRTHGLTVGIYGEMWVSPCLCGDFCPVLIKVTQSSKNVRDKINSHG